jgi:hypothetical protein
MWRVSVVCRLCVCCVSIVCQLCACCVPVVCLLCVRCVALFVCLGGWDGSLVAQCWAVSRDNNSVLVADPTAFPDGIKAVADYVHSKGFKFGICECACTRWHASGVCAADWVVVGVCVGVCVGVGWGGVGWGGEGWFVASHGCGALFHSRAGWYERPERAKRHCAVRGRPLVALVDSWSPPHRTGVLLALFADTDRGNTTCAGRPASGGHEALDAQTFASTWAVHTRLVSPPTQPPARTQPRAVRAAVGLPVLTWCGV